MKRLRVLVLMHPDLIPPESTKGRTEQEINVWKTEYDVVTTLRAAGHDVKPLGVHDELKPIRDQLDAWKPDVVFTLLEQFHGEAIYDQNVVSYLELMHVPYTGCNPRGLMLARGKDLSKTLVHYHRVPVPAFAVFPMRRKVKRPARLALPLIVKSVNEDASYGISQASVVDTDEKLVERVGFIHERIGTAAIAEQYIEGREIYVGIVGNDRLLVLPVWELQFREDGARRLADRHREGQARHRTIRNAAAFCMGRPRTCRPSSPLASRPWLNGPTARWSSTAMRVSIFGLRPTARRIFSKPILIQKSPRARNSPLRRGMSASSYPDLLQRIVALGMQRSHRRAWRWTEHS